MKKHLIAVLLVLAMCLSVFAGCSLVSSLERDVQVILKHENAYIGTYTVNAFNNAVVPEQTRDGYKFAGWSVKDNWTEGVDSEELLTENTALIRYDDVKDYVGDHRDSVTLYSAFRSIPRHDVAIAWYDKEGTSGLNQGHIDSFTNALNEFLVSQSRNPAEMDIVIRNYPGSVGDTCSAIKEDGDIDIMIGWSSTGNLVDVGGWTEGEDFIVNHGGVKVGAKDRYAALLRSNEFTNMVYFWIFDTYGSQGRPVIPDGSTPVDPEPEPEPEPEPSEKEQLVVAYYDAALSGTTKTGITADIAQSFGGLLSAYLAGQNAELYGEDKLEVVMKGYGGDVSESTGAITTDGNVDLMIGWGKKMPLDTKEHTEGVYIGTENRYATRLTDSELANLAYDWILSTYTEAAVKTKVVVGWYGKTSTSGLDAAIIAKVETALNAYLAAQGYAADKYTVEFREYAQSKVADMGAAINADGDVDVMLGVGNNINSDAGVSIKEKIGGIAMGEKTRYNARLTDSVLSKLVYDWAQSEEACALYV